jgi:hypothetical protein
VVEVALGFVALVLAGLVLVALGVELISAAVGRHVTVWSRFPIPHTHQTRVLALFVVLGASLALLALLARGRPAPLRAEVEGGSLRLPPDTLARFLDARLGAQPDVVATRSRFALSDGAVVADLWVALRPLAPVERLEPALREAATTALCAELGLAAHVRGVRFRVLRVRDLPRYLRA